MVPENSPLERAYAAIRAVQQRFKTIVSALRGANIPFAVIGNQATSLWIATVDELATRTARDTELLLDREDCERACCAAKSVGLSVLQDSAKLRLGVEGDPQRRNLVTVFWATEKAFETDVIVAPRVNEAIVLNCGRPVLPLEMHIAAQLSWYRLDDRVDILDMMRVDLISEDLPQVLPHPLDARLRQIFEQYRRDYESWRWH